MQTAGLTLWAAHITEGILSLPWLAAGFALAAVLWLAAVVIDLCRGWLQGRELREEEIAQVALLTAAFFVASQIHIPIGAVFTVHLLLNGLLGIVLRWRAALAIPVGLFLQAALFNHGGFSTLGVNACVMVIPALLAWGLFAGLHRLPWLTHAWFRGLLVGLSAMSFILGLVYSVALISSNNLFDLTAIDPTGANQITFHPLTLLVALAVSAALAMLEPRLENAPEFPLGLFIGMVAVQLTMLLNAGVLYFGAAEDLRSLALLTFVAHMPLAVLEGFILGGVVGFLVKVRPALLGWQRQPHFHVRPGPQPVEQHAE